MILKVLGKKIWFFRYQNKLMIKEKSTKVILMQGNFPWRV